MDSTWIKPGARRSRKIAGFDASRARRRPGFTLIELLVVIAIIALLIGILMPVFSEARTAGRAAVCASNMRQFGIAGATYASDFEDRIFAFSWRAGRRYSRYPLLGPQPTDIGAAAAQAVDILRRRADRPDMPAGLANGRWIPHVLYTHLVLQDYLAQRLPEPMVACPADLHRLDWQRDPQANFDQGIWLPFQPRPPRPGGGNLRWPYSSSYQAVPASYDGSEEGQRIRQLNFSNSYFLPLNSSLGGLRLSSVVFPGSKVQLMDEEQRHSGGRRLYYAVPEAIQPLLTFDGSVQSVRTADCNPGWQPNSPRSGLPTNFRYWPSIWEAQPSNGARWEFVDGMYRWTREGLKGVDFGASEPG